MPLGDKIGEDTASDVNQYVHSWIDDIVRRLQDLQVALDGQRIRIKGDFTVELEKKEP